MPVLLNWSARTKDATSQVVYRSTAWFDKNSLPASLAILGPTETSYRDESADPGVYWYLLETKVGARSVFTEAKYIQVYTSGPPVILQFYSHVAALELYRTTDTAITAGYIPMQAANNEFNWFASGNLGGQITVPSGLDINMVRASTCFVTTGVTRVVDLYIRLNGVSLSMTGSDNVTYNSQNMCAIIPATGGDVIGFYVSFSSNSTITAATIKQTVEGFVTL